MTASLKFEIEDHEDVLMVPNAALRWKPSKKQIAADVRDETWAAMNRPKQTDNKKAERKRHSESGPAGSGQSAVSVGQDSSLAASAGTAGGSTPENWKTVMKKEARKKDKKVEPVAVQGPKSSGGRQPPGQALSPQDAAALKEHREYGRLWTADGNFVRPVPVEIVATDGTMTEVRGRKGAVINEGDEIVIGVNVASESGDDTVNPFAPKIFKGNAKSSGSK
jgi:hypothetical protein